MSGKNLANKYLYFIKEKMESDDIIIPEWQKKLVLQRLAKVILILQR
jgi:hypothetical protein